MSVEIMQQELEVAAPEYRYTDAELVSMIAQEMRDSSTDVGSRMAGQRRMAYDAYYGEWPAPLPGVASEHRARDVLDAVEGIKAKLLRTFSSTRTPVYFEATGEWDTEAAECATDYVKTVFYRENAGYRILSWAFHDALIAKQCVIKRWVETKTVRTPENFSDVPEEALSVVAANPGIELAEVTSAREETAIIPTYMGPVTQSRRLVSGVIYRVEQQQNLVVDVVPPEDFGMNAGARSVEDATFIWERHDYTKSELVAMGFDPEVVETLTGNPMSGTDTEKLGRHGYDDTLQTGKRGQNERTLIPTYEVHLLVDMDDDAEAELWKVITADSKVLWKERVSEKPYRTWSPIQISHKAVGLSAADVVVDLQRTRSNLIRGMVDNLYRTNNPTRIANLSGGVIRNPADLINNPPGLVIDSSDPTAVQVPPQPSLNPATMAVYELLTQEKESRTGMSRLAQGLNSDAVRQQNAADKISELMNASNERVLEMARSFAEIVLKPLFQDIYRLGYESGHVVQMAQKGQLAAVGPKMLGYRANMTVSVALTDEELSRRTQTLVALHQLLSADQAIAPLYGLQERYGLYASLFDLAGYSSAFLKNPSDPEVQQQLQAMAMEAKQREQKAEAMALAGIKLREAEIESRTSLAKEKLDLDATIRGDAQNLDEREFDWQKRKDVAEFTLERDQGRPVALQ